MPKGPRGESRPADLIGCAVAVARIATGEADDVKRLPGRKRLGGVAGGKARASNLSDERRNEIARTAAAVRWKIKEAV